MLTGQTKAGLYAKTEEAIVEESEKKGKKGSMGRKNSLGQHKGYVFLRLERNICKVERDEWMLFVAAIDVVD